MDYEMIVFSVFGGLALFLYGMTLLSEGLQKAAGDKLKSLLEKLTDNKIKGVVMGTLVTMIIQSSSATTVTLVGLINAKIITLAQAVPVIMGANIGTTITAQIIAFKLSALSLPIIAAGAVFFFRAKNERWKSFGTVLIGFGVLFLGLEIMSSEVKHLAKDQGIVHFLASLGKFPLLAVFASLVFTEIIQSSSATTGVIIVMGQTGMIDLQTAICFVLGANMGTTITVCLAAFGTAGSSISAKRSAIVHVLFNVFGSSLFLPFISQFTRIVGMTSSEIPRQIANSHTIFNVIITILFLPFSWVLIKIVTYLIPGNEVSIAKGVKYLDDNTLKTPAVALAMAEKETMRMGKITLSMVESGRKALLEKDKDSIMMVKEKEKLVDHLDDEIELFLQKIDPRYLSKAEESQMNVCLHVIAAFERIADHANNITELAENRITRKISFSREASDELEMIFEMASDSIDKSVRIIKECDVETAEKIMKIEKKVDELVISYEQENFDRLTSGKCSSASSSIYLDTLRNLERITDHTHNIAAAEMHGF